jgi:tetratricopeptide (TPR) repeat protein
LFAAGFAWLPNALLPNHHFSGYSWNGAYILYLPIILIPVFWQSDVRLRFLSVILISLAFISPILNKAEYLKNNWLLIQENTQRNLLTSLEPLMEGLSIDNSEKILVTGLVFPFSPFKFPQSLRTYPKMHNANFDVVTYSSDLIGERIDLVKFIRPIDVDLQNYTKIWMFSSDGYLVRELRIGIDSIVPVLGLEAKDFVIFPDVAVIFGLDNAVSVNPEISSDGYRLLNCGNAFSAYKQSELALRCYVASTKKIPENPYGWFGAGVELERLNRFDEAKQYFAQSVEHDNTKTPNPAFKKAYLKSKRHSTVNTSDDSIRH